MSNDNMEEGVSLLNKVAQKFSVKPEDLMRCLKDTAFRQKDGKEMTRSQMIQMLIVIDRYNLNPWMKEIYAYPDKGGAVVPVVGIDGWLRMINEHPKFDGMEFRFSVETTIPPDGKVCPEWIECVIFRKDREHATIVREYLDEVYRPPMVKDNRKIFTPWQSHTKRFLRHKGIVQAARVAFSFVGVYDDDEAQRILEADPSDEPQAEARPARGGKLTGISGLKTALGVPSEPVVLPQLDVVKPAAEASAATDNAVAEADAVPPPEAA
jgi:phage recombination protein Bet